MAHKPNYTEYLKHAKVILFLDQPAEPGILYHIMRRAPDLEKAGVTKFLIECLIPPPNAPWMPPPCITDCDKPGIDKIMKYFQKFNIEVSVSKLLLRHLSGRGFDTQHNIENFCNSNRSGKVMALINPNSIDQLVLWLKHKPIAAQQISFQPLKGNQGLDIIEYEEPGKLLEPDELLEPGKLLKSGKLLVSTVFSKVEPIGKCSNSRCFLAICEEVAKITIFPNGLQSRTPSPPPNQPQSRPQAQLPPPPQPSRIRTPPPPNKSQSKHGQAGTTTAKLLTPSRPKTPPSEHKTEKVQKKGRN